MGAPLVRRDEFEAELDKLKASVRKERNAGKAKAQDPDLAFITRRDLAIALAPVYAALEIGVDDTAPSPVEFPTPLEVAEAGEVEPAPITGFENIDQDAEAG